MIRLVTLKQFIDSLPKKVPVSPGKEEYLMEMTNCTVVAYYVWQTLQNTYKPAKQYEKFMPNAFGYRMIGNGHNFVTVNTSDLGYVILQPYQSLWNLNTWLQWDQQINIRVRQIDIFDDYNDLVGDVCSKGERLISENKIIVDPAKKKDILDALKTIPNSVTSDGLISWL